MRALLPDPVAEVDPLRAYTTDRPAPAGRPWLLVNMVASLDGAISVEGRSGGLGGPADRRVFSALRSLADVILVGASTVRAEGYGPARITDDLQATRVERGQSPTPQIAVISASLQLDLSSSLFSESATPPLVITAPGSSQARRVEVSRAADLLLAGQAERVDMPEALILLGDLGARVVLCEGGPTLNAQLLAHDLVDELCLTIAPLMVGGPAPRAASGEDVHPPLGFRLAHLLEEDGALFLRSVRTGR